MINLEKCRVNQKDCKTERKYYKGSIIKWNWYEDSFQNTVLNILLA